MTDYRLPINYLDTGRVARDKINDSFNELNSNFDQLVVTVQGYRPHIEDGYWWIGNTNTGVYAVGVKLRDEDNLTKRDTNDDVYTDLQFENGLTPTSVFPIGITVGNVSSEDGWSVSGVMINNKTPTSYTRMLYGSDGKLYFDDGLGVFKSVATSSDLTSALETLRSELATVAFTGKSSDLNNDAEFTADKVLTMEEYEQIPGTAGDDKNYWIFENEN